MYQVKREDGTTYITTENPNKTRLGIIRDWFIDKWWWLKTFNKPPTVTINQNLVAYKGGPPAVVSDGRITIVVNGDITLKPFNGSIEIKGTIIPKQKKSPKYTGS